LARWAAPVIVAQLIRAWTGPAGCPRRHQCPVDHRRPELVAGADL